MRPMDCSPDAWGAHRASIFPHAGPTSYTQVTNGTAPAVATGGDTVQAVEAGMKLFDLVLGGICDSGDFRVDAMPVSVSGLVSGQVLPATPTTTYKLKWTALRTATIGGQAQTINTQAAASTNLSAEIVRLLGIGPK